jgi:methyl coenzyme M reductase alpha subunit
LEAERAYCVHSVYQQRLGREPDPNGLQHYMDALRNGAPFSHLIREIEKALRPNSAASIWKLNARIVSIQSISNVWGV